MHKKIFYLKLLTLLFAFIIFYIMGEIFVRVFNKYEALNPITTREYRRIDPIFNCIFVPNTTGRFRRDEYDIIYKINSLGLRDYEYTLRKPDNTYRIIVMGDSFAEGWGVNIENTAVKELERILNSGTYETRYEVINAGMGALSPVIEYVLLEKKIIFMEPDMIILFFNHTDVWDDFTTLGCVIFDENGLPAAVPQTDFLVIPEKKHKTALARFLNRHSPFYLFVRKKLKRFQRKISTIVLKKKRKEDVGVGLIPGDPKRDMMFMCRGSDEDIMNCWKDTRRYLKGMNDLLRKKNIKFIIVTYPHEPEVKPFGCAHLRKHRKLEAGKRYYPQKALSLLEDFTEENNIPLINLYEDFTKNTETSLYYQYDAHWNAKGQKFVGRCVHKRLKNMLK